jgi:co-chaperonin GroES (HSP10)
MLPAHDWVVCALMKEELVSPGGIITPDVSHVAGSNIQELEVIAAGPSGTSGLIPGDRLKVVGKCPTFMCDGDEYFMVRDAQPGIWPVERANIGDRIEMLPVGQPFICCIIRKGELKAEKKRDKAGLQ